MANDKDFRVKNGIYVATDASILGNAVIGNRLSANGNVNLTNSPNVALGPVGNVVITGGSSGQYLQTNGSGGLSWATVSASGGSNISNGNSNVSIATAAGNITMSVNGTSNVVVVSNTSLQLGTGSGGNISGVNVMTANTFVGSLSGAATTAGTVTTAAQPNITSVGTLSSLSVSGNGTFGNILGPHANGNSNVNIPAANGNVNITAVGNTTLVVTGTGANVTGTLNASGNANVGNLGTGGLIVATGNVSGANVISSAYSIVSVGTGISAAGTVQSNATAITKEFNVVSTVASGSGVSLPTAVAGMRITVINTSANALNVYPLGNGIINSAAANVAYAQPAGARLDFICTAAATAPGGQWYTLNATYG